MVKVVIDTNVLISGLLKTSVTCRRIIHKLSNKEFSLIVSKEILEEFIEVMGRPKFHHIIMKETAERLIEVIRTQASIVHPRQKLTICRDPEDNKFLEAASEGKADFLITGGEDLLSLESLHKTRILSPSEFVKITKS